MSAELLTWDWRGQPDLKHLARAIEQLSGGTVHLYEADEHLAVDEVETVWRQVWYGEDR
jgi:hypothetical protein